jgi:hypothetical protein
VILAWWRGDRHRSAVFGRDEQLGATVLDRFSNGSARVISKAPAEPHVVAFSIKIKVTGLQAQALNA